MTKTCGKCGHAALEDQAQFCNRCGAAVPEEKKHAFPVCPGCGTVVSDELAQFCNRCGARIPAVPAVCSTCGNPAIDDQSRFCTRCGTTFDQKTILRTPACPSCGAPDPGGQAIFCNRCGTPFTRPAAPSAHHHGHAPVIVTQRKPVTPLPAVPVPDTDWEPWNDLPTADELPQASGLILPEQSPDHDQQIAVPQKRYAHLPLIAEELKKKSNDGDLRLPPEIPGPSQKKRAAPQKKGVLGFLKK